MRLDVKTIKRANRSSSESEYTVGVDVVFWFDCFFLGMKKDLQQKHNVNAFSEKQQKQKQKQNSKLGNLKKEGNNGLSVKLLIFIAVSLKVALMLLHSPHVHLEEASDSEQQGYR